MRKILVILRNKLISCDTAVPLMMDLAARRPDLLVEFTTFEDRTYEVIRQNVVLYDAIMRLGHLTFRGRSARERASRVLTLLHRLKSMLWIGRITLRAALGQLSIMHFASKDEGSLKLWGRFVPNHLFCVEGTSVGYAPLEERVGELMMPRKHADALPSGQYLIGFSDYWPPMSDPRASDRVRKRLPPPFTSKHWLSYIGRTADKYLETEFREAGVEASDRIGVFMLTWMGSNGLLRERDLFPQLYREALDALEAACGDMPVFIKPHPVMSEAEREWARNEARAREGLRVVWTDLHPMVLASRAAFALGLCYSTTFSVLRFMQVPTIEYTAYADHILAETKGGSMRPEFVTHFIDRNSRVLRQLLDELSHAERAAPPEGVTLFRDEELVSALCGSRDGSNADSPLTVRPATKTLND